MRWFDINQSIMNYKSHLCDRLIFSPIMRGEWCETTACHFVVSSEVSDVDQMDHQVDQMECYCTSYASEDSTKGTDCRL